MPECRFLSFWHTGAENWCDLQASCDAFAGVALRRDRAQTLAVQWRKIGVHGDERTQYRTLALQWCKIGVHGNEGEISWALGAVLTVFTQGHVDVGARVS